METNKFVCVCLGIDGGVIDRICDDFDIDLTDTDVIEAIKNGIGRHWGAAEELLLCILHYIMEQYDELDEDKFDYDFSSPSYPSFYYGEQEFSTKKGLDAIAGLTNGSDKYVFKYSTEAGDFELELTEQDILDCSHRGMCDADCERVAEKEYVQKQLQNVSNEAMLSALAQMGVEVEDETDRKALYEQIVWDAACNMREDITGSLSK